MKRIFVGLIASLLATSTSWAQEDKGRWSWVTSNAAINALNGINTVTFMFMGDPDTSDYYQYRNRNPCGLEFLDDLRKDTELFATTIRKLHLVAYDAWDKESRRLSDSKEWEKATAHIGAPHLTVTVHTKIVPGGCFAVVETSVTIAVQATKTVTNEQLVLYPHIEVWHQLTGVSAPFNKLSEAVNTASYEEIKEFIHDWMEAQLP